MSLLITLFIFWDIWSVHTILQFLSLKELHSTVSFAKLLSKIHTIFFPIYSLIIIVGKYNNT